MARWALPICLWMGLLGCRGSPTMETALVLRLSLEGNSIASAEALREVRPGSTADRPSAAGEILVRAYDAEGRRMLEGFRPDPRFPVAEEFLPDGTIRGTPMALANASLRVTVPMPPSRGGRIQLQVPTLGGERIESEIEFDARGGGARGCQRPSTVVGDGRCVAGSAD